MGLTPIEGGSDAGDGTPRGEDARDVQQRLRAAVSHLVGGVFERVSVLLPSGKDDRGAVPPNRGSRDRPARRDGIQREEAVIRPSGQARLESGRGKQQLPARRTDGTPAHRRELRAEARLGGDTLRVYDPDSEDAYITSDIYERIER
jgi:hypothetical protein